MSLAQLRRRAVRGLRRLRFGNVFGFLLVTGLAFFALLPITYTVVTAFKPLDELWVYPPRFLVVVNPTLQNFIGLFKATDTSIVPFSRYFFNTIVYTTITLSLMVVISSGAAYALSKLKMKWAGLYFKFIISALVVAPAMLTLPRYMVVNSLGLNNTYWALILPPLASAFNVFLIKQFVDQFPDVLIEAAKIDGASEYGIYAKMVFPNIGPAIATMLIFAFPGVWFERLAPTIYLTDQSMKMLINGLDAIGGGGIGRAGASAAVTFISTVPLVIFFMAMQRRVVETMAYSGIKM